MRGCAREGTIEDVIGHAISLLDAFRLVEGPMNPEINSALSIFFFRFRKAREVTRHVGPQSAGVIVGSAIEFIGNKSESKPIGAEESAERLEKRATKSSVTRRISGKRRREIWTGEIIRRRA
jgi:hypothetical protein